jgi:polysaccharide export outer membrane protein
MKTAVLCASWIRASWLCACVATLALAACSNQPLGEDVIAQARADGQVAFDVVKIDDAVLTTLSAQPSVPFHQRFKKYVPPPELKIAVGDIASVVIWESAANGLFGNSLTELLFPAGAASSRLGGRGTTLSGISTRPGGLIASPETLSRLFGGAGPGGTAALGAAAGPGGAAGLGLTEQAGTPSGSLSTSGYGVLGGSAAGLGTGTGLMAEAASGRAAGGVLGQGQLRAAQGARSERLEALLEAAAQSGRPGTLIPDQRVGPDGAITIPYAGRIPVAGRTAAEVERTIEQRLDGKALDPQAQVIIKQSAANSVSVAGDVIGGKRVPLSPGGDRLLQVIAAAGGAQAPPGETFVRLSRGGVTATVPLAALVAEPDQDIFAEPGDVLTLVRQRQSFSVFGATGKNAAITFNSDRLSLSEALAKAGGLLDDRADPRAVFLFRYEPAQLVRALGQPLATAASGGVSPVVYRLDLMEGKSYHIAQRFPVRDKDIIFVADAKTQPIYKFFRVLSLITGPIQTGAAVCISAKC